ncbi:MAG: tetraacyldisaccharide 4'-kinase [Sterolibacteriaceae bacterium MAG5]|nr:tetraacyldisaccharide 4'-kinase [Candidatus Nitricoxidireducens bremensis]
MIAAWQKRGPAALALLPLAFFFSVLVSLRRRAYRAGWLRRVRLPVPVVVVGNIAVGGAGKTPIVLALVQAMQAAGRHPGIVSRGYRGSVEGVREVRADDGAEQVGDEPLLLKGRCGCPVFVGRDRAAAGAALLAAYPDCDVIVSDDGLQHYRLARDVEIAVIDGRMLDNHWMLPAGPLRESPARLAGVDAIVRNGDVAVAVHGVPTFQMTLVGDRFVRLDAPDQCAAADDLRGARLHAVAGIGNPRRFFDHLAALGLAVVPHAFPDHHRYAAPDLDFQGDAILATEKDGVKLRGLAKLPVWVLPVEARIEPDLARYVMEKLDGRPPA